MSTAPGDEIVLKILHTADWHLGRRFDSFPEREASDLARDRLRVLERVFGLAERHAVDAVLCAGDLFDEPTPTSDWWKGLSDQLNKLRWKDRPVFLLPGNHDPCLADSVWGKQHKFRASLPSWVHVVDDFLEYPISNDAVLYAVPCRSASGQKDPTQEIPVRAPGDERIRIGMVHGSTFDMPEHQNNFPISRDASIERGLDYLALGDTHGFRFVPADRKEQPMIYPGTPEPTAFDERDPGKVAVVFFNRRRRADVHGEKVSRWTWEERTVSSLAELRTLAKSDLATCVLRLKVAMTLEAAEYEEAESILEDLQGTDAKHGRAGVFVLDRTEFEMDMRNTEQVFADQPDIVRAVVRRLQEKAAHSPAEAHMAERAIRHLYRVARGK